jgi:hypothetical protein
MPDGRYRMELHRLPTVPLQARQSGRPDCLVTFGGTVGEDGCWRMVISEGGATVIRPPPTVPPDYPVSNSPTDRPYPHIIASRSPQRTRIAFGLSRPCGQIARFEGQQRSVVKLGHGRMGIGGAVEARNCDRTRSDVHAIAIWHQQSLCPSTSLLRNHDVHHLARG